MQRWLVGEPKPCKGRKSVPVGLKSEMMMPELCASSPSSLVEAEAMGIVVVRYAGLNSGSDAMESVRRRATLLLAGSAQAIGEPPVVFVVADDTECLNSENRRSRSLVGELVGAALWMLLADDMDRRNNDMAAAAGAVEEEEEEVQMQLRVGVRWQPQEKCSVVGDEGLGRLGSTVAGDRPGLPPNQDGGADLIL